MGARGPAPTPTKILNMRGSWRGKARGGEPQPAEGRPRRPRGFTDEEKRLWRNACDALESMGVLTKADWPQLERWVRYYARWRQCERWIAQHGISYKVLRETPEGGDKQEYVGRAPGSAVAVVRFAEWPEVRESRNLDKQLKEIEAQFGLTPSARARLATGKAAEAADEFEDFLRGPKLA